MSGRTSYLAGLAAEEAVARLYQQQGHQVLARRWRGQGGELDLIVQGPGGLVFVEVKKSRDFSAAAARVSPAQARRIYATAAEFLGTLPNGSLLDTRFDVVLLDQHGQTQVIENALLR